MLYLHVHVCIVHTVFENALLFFCILRGLTVVLGAPVKYNYEAPERGGGAGGSLGASLGPPTL